MNRYSLKRKDLEINDEDSWLTRLWKNARLRFGVLVYEFDSLNEFQDCFLDKKIRSKSVIHLQDLHVEFISRDRYGLNLTLTEGAQILTFERLYQGNQDRGGVGKNIWLKLDGLKIGDDVSLLEMVYYSPGNYRITAFQNKNGPGDLPKKSFPEMPALPPPDKAHTLDEVLI